MSHLKPKTSQDITSNQESVYAARSLRVNLRRQKVVRIPLIAACKALVIVASVGYFLFGMALAPIDILAQTSSEERAQLEAQLKQLEAQIDQYEGEIADYKKKGRSLSGEVSQLNAKISKLNLQIQAIVTTMKQLDQKIGQTQQQISVTESNIGSNREALAELIRNLYISDQASLMEIFLKHPQLSDFFTDVNNVMVLQGNLRTKIAQIRTYQEQLIEHKQDLSLAKADAEEMQRYTDATKRATQLAQSEKNTLLKRTQSEEAKYQALLKETQKTANEIKNRLFSLLGGGQMTFQQAYQYAKVASDATGVRPALILAVLDRESALGKNVGKCNYKQSMRPSEQVIFEKLLKELGMDPNGVNVSCAIPSDGAYGGAMGPAQFMPSTWRAYQDRISRLTGQNPPSPWNNAAAFTGTGLYLKDAGAAGGSINQERIAAAKYYAGGNYSRFLWTYGQAVINHAERFEKDIDTILGVN